MSDKYKKSQKRIQAEKKMRKRLERSKASNSRPIAAPENRRRSDESVKSYERALSNRNSASKRRDKYENIHKVNRHNYKQNRYVNISFFLFIIIFCYIVYHMISYARAEDYSSTIVESGTLVNSQTFRGLIVRDEATYTATKSGDFRIFINQGERVKTGMNVAGIIENSEEIKILEEEIAGASEDLSIDTQLSDEVLNNMRKSFRNFTVNNNFKGVNYTNHYGEKLSFGLALIRENYLLANSKYADEYLRLKEKYNEKISFAKADKSGVLSFAIDGKEELNLNNIDYDYVSKLEKDLEFSYKEKVQKGDVAFKIINDYLWYAVMEIDDVCEKEIEDSAYLTVKLGKEKEKLFARVYKVENKGDKTYLTLEFDRLLNSFLDRRIIDVEIVHNDFYGLKIPEKSLSSKTFVKIPKDYFQYINGENSVLISGEEELLKLYNINVFREDDEGIWIPKDDNISVGVEIYLGDIKNKKNKSFNISEEKEFHGVYVINRGYADFKFVDIIYEDDGFLIVKDNTPYGLRIYDRIITDSRAAKEDMLVR